MQQCVALLTRGVAAEEGEDAAPGLDGTHTHPRCMKPDSMISAYFSFLVLA